ncbi:hypothetical protein GCM10023196_031450 [Actinoallomurus vinaceus]|uniref:Uncharacterized protein n=1 Tax=Actinoallomurus vinaceus TaxID=1080074 RepID=A0ABP8U7M0_9ACTN
MKVKNTDRATIVVWGTIAIIDLCFVLLVWLNDPNITKGLRLGVATSFVVAATAILVTAIGVPMLAGSFLSRRKRSLRFIVRIMAIAVGVLGLDSALSYWGGPWMLLVFGGFAMYMMVRHPAPKISSDARYND